MARRNSVVELLRFLCSFVVVGFHVQEWRDTDDYSFFENGCSSVEFFFILSGFFMGKSVEKVSKKPDFHFLAEYWGFMWGKIKGILRLHIIVNIFEIIVILIWDTKHVGKRIVQGLPQLFLVQNIVVWTETTDLITPEWYLSAMLLCMAVIFPCSIIIRRRLNLIWTSLIMLGVLIIILLIYGLARNWDMLWSFACDLRAWGEMCISMMALIVSNWLAGKELSHSVEKVFCVVEIISYSLVVLIGFVPEPTSLQNVMCGVVVVFSLIGVTITFARKGIQVSGTPDQIFSYLGTLSLPIYLFHPPLLDLLKESGAKWHMSLTLLVGFVGALILSLADKYIHAFITSRITRLCPTGDASEGSAASTDPSTAPDQTPTAPSQENLEASTSETSNAQSPPIVTSAIHS